MTKNNGPHVWPKDLVILQWLLAGATLVCAGQCVYFIAAYREDYLSVLALYCVSLLLFFTAGACASAFMRKLRLFVLLALVSQVLTAFVALFCIVADLVTFFVGSGYARPGGIWNLLFFGFAARVVTYLVPRHLVVRSTTPAPSASA